MLFSRAYSSFFTFGPFSGIEKTILEPKTIVLAITIAVSPVETPVLAADTTVCESATRTSVLAAETLLGSRFS